MAEPQGNTEQDRATQREGVKVTQTGTAGVQGETRSFKAGDVARGANLAGADTGRQMAEAGRRAGQSAVDAFSRTFDPFMALQLDMNRWFDDLWRQTTGFGIQSPLRTARPMASIGPASLFGLPPTDFKETAKTYELAVELPGLTREDIDLSLRNDVLTIRGHKSEETEDAQAAYRVSERRFGRFERSFPIPDDVNPSGVEAAFRDGVLKITLPKTAESAERQSRIPIKG